MVLRGLLRTKGENVPSLETGSPPKFGSSKVAPGDPSSGLAEVIGNRTNGQFPKCMVRRATAREKRRGDRQVCANVFGLWVESEVSWP
jgi:hypothetical protein